MLCAQALKNASWLVAKKTQQLEMDFPIHEATELLEKHHRLVEHWASTFLTTSFDNIVEHVRPFIDNPRLQEEFHYLCNRCQYKRNISHSITPLNLKPCNDGMSPKKRHEVEYLVPYLKDLVERNNIHTLVDVGAGKCFGPLTFLKAFPDDKDYQTCLPRRCPLPMRWQMGT